MLCWHKSFRTTEARVSAAHTQHAGRHPGQKEDRIMQRRDFFKAAAAGAVAVSCWKGFALAKEYFPVKVDETLFEGINRIKDPANESVIEKLHWPVITAPEKVKAGEAFTVAVSIGSMLHPMGPEHWIEYLQLNIGNEPAGTLLFRSRGCLTPQGKFNLKLGENLKGKTVSIAVQDKCNLHGIWQNYVNIEVV
jgi:superoxide reductase